MPYMQLRQRQLKEWEDEKDMHRLLNARFKRDIDADRIKGVHASQISVPAALAVNRSSDLKESGGALPAYQQVNGNRSVLGVSGRRHHTTLNPSVLQRPVQALEGSPP